MVYTITFNPALDYIARVLDFKYGAVNRTKSEKIYPGGKGINVSIVLNSLGVKTCALGFIAGFTGREITRLVSKTRTRTDFLELSDGNSRINIKLRSDIETEINGVGPRIDDTDLNKLFLKLSALTKDDILVLSGSFQVELPEDTYAKIMREVREKNILVVVDALRGLTETLKYKPFLIKPNRAELCEIFNEKSLDEKGVIYYAKKLQKLGARNVLVSLGSSGALLLDEYSEIHKSPALKGSVINTVGAGDSMVAGFIAGYLESRDYLEAFKLSLAAGSATAFSEWLASGKEIRRIYEAMD